MEEIKFKGISKIGKQWVYGGVITTPIGPFISKVDSIFTEEDWLDSHLGYTKIIPETLSQYLEFSDCEGTDVYENDIVEIYLSIQNISQ